MLKFYAGFEINDQTGEALTDHEMTDIHYDSITSLQVTVFFSHFVNLFNDKYDLNGRTSLTGTSAAWC